MENIIISSKLSKKFKYSFLAICLVFILISIILLKKWSSGNTSFLEDAILTVCGFSLPFLLLYFWMISKMQITVTNKSVCGRSYFGRSIDLPLDSVSAVGSKMFNGITVSTSSGKIKFLYIENASKIHEEIRKLLINRQEQKITNTPTTSVSNVDEIKKYKELFDSGVITEEEFNQIKSDLLNKL